MKLSISILRRRKASVGYVKKSASYLRQVIIFNTHARHYLNS